MKRKRFSIRFLALILPACTVDTPVVEGNDASIDDRLGAGLGAWCEATCAKYADCAPDAEQADCADNCDEAFRTSFIGKGEECAAGALRLMDCIEQASCMGLELEVCQTQREINRCADSAGQVACQSRFGGAPAGTSSSCVVEYDDCSNERIYQVSCAGSPRECECLVDGSTTGRFRYDGADCPQPFEARQICGWPIVPLRDEPPTPPTVSCKLGSTSSGLPGDGSVGDCEIIVQDCSDGINYGIVCEGSTAGMCTCQIDGEQVGSFVSSDTICPYVYDLDYGGAAMNHACGFSITSAIPRL